MDRCDCERPPATVGWTHKIVDVAVSVMSGARHSSQVVNAVLDAVCVPQPAEARALWLRGVDRGVERRRVFGRRRVARDRRVRGRARPWPGRGASARPSWPLCSPDREEPTSSSRKGSGMCLRLSTSSSGVTVYVMYKKWFSFMNWSDFLGCSYWIHVQELYRHWQRQNIY